MSGKKTQDRIEVTVGLALQDLVAALKKMDTEEREDFIESLLAATSPEYLRSIEEARRDWREGRVKSHEQLFKSAG
jgi:hypothetical protein